MTSLAERIAEWQITATAEPDYSYTGDDWDRGASHWRVTLSRPYVVDGNNGCARMVTEFHQGSTHTEPPTVEDVMSCLLLDASGVDQARDFEDWASDYGYDTDSRKAEKIYNDCRESAEDLDAFLYDGGTDYMQTWLYETDNDH